MELSMPPRLSTRFAAQRNFPKFSELAPEIRIQIWEYASNFCRALELLYCVADHQFLTVQNVPAVLHTTKESREVALSFYHLSFGTAKHAPKTYFNPTADILYFGSRQYDDERGLIFAHFFKSSAELEPRDQIRRVAFAERLWKQNTPSSPFRLTHNTNIWFDNSFPYLQDLFFVKPRIFHHKEHTEDGFEDSPEDYNGIILVDSELDAGIVDNPKYELKRVIAFAGRARKPSKFAVKFLEYGHWQRECIG